MAVGLLCECPCALELYAASAKRTYRAPNVGLLTDSCACLSNTICYDTKRVSASYFQNALKLSVWSAGGACYNQVIE